MVIASARVLINMCTTATKEQTDSHNHKLQRSVYPKNPGQDYYTGYWSTPLSWTLIQTTPKLVV